MAGSRKTRPGARDDNDTAQAVRDSAQKIWLAGLGAFERARTEGPRMFETLVEQGRNMGARAVGAADDVLKSVRQADYSGRWDKLEQVFEDRVSRSLQRLGVLTAQDVESLSRQVRELNEHVRNLVGGGAGVSSTRRRTKKAAKGARKAGSSRGGTKKAATGARKSGASAGTKKAAAKRKAPRKKAAATRGSRARQA